MTGTLILVAVIAGMVLYLVVLELLERRPPPELRGDWWSSFERQFRAYARGGRAAPGPPNERPGNLPPA
jgi:hypothetical protein